MASFYGHLSFSAALAAAYGAAGVAYGEFDWGDIALASGLVMIGGMLPDLDSDSGIPVREMFGISAAVGALLAYARLRHGFNHEQAIVVAAGIYFFIRYGLSRYFKWATVHRGMFHSLPALFICGLGLYLLLPGLDPLPRYYFASAIMLGFLSHLVLDEIYAVNFNGIIPRLNQFAGSAVKLYSKSLVGNLTCYGLLAALVWVLYEEKTLMPMEAPEATQKPLRRLRQKLMPRFPGQVLPGPTAPGQPFPGPAGPTAPTLPTGPLLPPQTPGTGPTPTTPTDGPRWNRPRGFNPNGYSTP